MVDDNSKKKILIVDDEEINIQLIKDYLKDSDFEIATAKNGLTALNYIKTYGDIDIILLDRMMPEMDGIEFMKELRTYSQYKYIPVIMQTALNSINNMSEGYSVGALYYLPKPFKQRILLEMIDKLLFPSDDENEPSEQQSN